MPRLVKGGKWVYGWSIVGRASRVCIPPDAYREYWFQAGDRVVFLRGSRTSGGCSVARSEAVMVSPVPLVRRSLGTGIMQAGGRVALPRSLDIRPGERLLVVRGSGIALGLIQRGPIFEEAMAHADLVTYPA